MFETSMGEKGKAFLSASFRVASLPLRSCRKDSRCVPLALAALLGYSVGKGLAGAKKKEKVKTEPVPRTSWNRRHAGGF